MLSLSDARFRPETAADGAIVAAICAEAFGPGRYARAAERIREMSPSDPDLCFVAEFGQTVVGAVRLTPIRIGDTPSLMLGPLAVRPQLKGKGIGKALMRLAAQAAQTAGWRAIILVGDQSYYWPLGYRVVPQGAIILPRPADPARLLLLELVPGASATIRGSVSGLVKGAPELGREDEAFPVKSEFHPPKSRISSIDTSSKID